MKRILKIGLAIAVGYALYRLFAEYLRPVSVRLDQPPYAFPPQPEPTSPAVAAEATYPPAAKSSRLDLNAADAETLTSLPGIGPTLAERIVAYRNENGPFGSIDDLTQIHGIGAAQANRLRRMVTV
jgi:competence ComEA-like helix-hairpin-helix protein